MLRRPTSDDYNEYMSSPQWRAKAEEALARAGYRCVDCSRTIPPNERHMHIKAYRLEVHHLTYVHFRNERQEDLCVLCRECHDFRHNTVTPDDFYTTFPKPWNVTSDEDSFAIRWEDEDEDDENEVYYRDRFNRL